MKRLLLVRVVFGVLVAWMLAAAAPPPALEVRAVDGLVATADLDFRASFVPAIGFVSALDHGNATNTTWTKSATIPSLTDGMMVACITGDTVGGNEDVTSMSVGGNAATLVRKNTAGANGSNRYFYMYALANPPSGSQSVVIVSTNSHFKSAEFGFYSGVDATLPPDSSNANQNTTNTSLTVSTTVVASNSWLVLCGSQNFTGGAMSAGTGTTKRVEEATFLINALFDSNGTVAAGSRSLQFTTGAATNNVGILASFAPTGGGGGAPAFPGAIINAPIRGGGRVR